MDISMDSNDPGFDGSGDAGGSGWSDIEINEKTDNAETNWVQKIKNIFIISRETWIRIIIYASGLLVLIVIFFIICLICKVRKSRKRAGIYNPQLKERHEIDAEFMFMRTMTKELPGLPVPDIERLI